MLNFFDKDPLVETSELSNIDRMDAVSAAHISDRGVESYEEHLGISIKDFIGKSVLDIGSGFGRFVREAREQGVKVTALEPNLIIKEKLRDYHPKEDSVAGLAQNLPFKDNSFDAITSIFAVPVYLETSAGEYDRTFREIVRTLKPGGTAYLWPIFEKLMTSKQFNLIREALADQAEIELRITRKDDERFKCIVVTKKKEIEGN